MGALHAYRRGIIIKKYRKARVEPVHISTGSSFYPISPLASPFSRKLRLFALNIVEKMEKRGRRFGNGTAGIMFLGFIKKRKEKNE